MHQLLEQGSVAQLIVLDAAQDCPEAIGIPAPIQQVIDKHAQAFTEPDGLPPLLGKQLPAAHHFWLPVAQGPAPRITTPRVTL